MNSACRPCRLPREPMARATTTRDHARETCTSRQSTAIPRTGYSVPLICLYGHRNCLAVPTIVVPTPVSAGQSCFGDVALLPCDTAPYSTPPPPFPPDDTRLEQPNPLHSRTTESQPRRTGTRSQWRAYASVSPHRAQPRPLLLNRPADLLRRNRGRDSCGRYERLLVPATAAAAITA